MMDPTTIPGTDSGAGTSGTSGDQTGVGVIVDASGVVVVITTSTGALNIDGLLLTNAATRNAAGVLVVFPGPATAHHHTASTPTWPVLAIGPDRGLAETWIQWASKRHPYSPIGLQRAGSRGRGYR